MPLSVDEVDRLPEGLVTHVRPLERRVQLHRELRPT